MAVRISIEGDDGDELRALNTWLSDEQELRGRVKLKQAPPRASDLGAIADSVVVAFGAGGAGTVLASSLITWLKTRRTTARLTVRTSDRTVELELETVDDVEPTLKQILDAAVNDGCETPIWVARDPYRRLRVRVRGVLAASGCSQQPLRNA